MRKQKNLFPRLMAVFLSVVLLFGMLPLGAMATDGETTSPEPSGVSSEAEVTEDDSGGETLTDPSEDTSNDPTEDNSEEPTDEGSEDPSGEGSEDPSGEGSEDPSGEGSEDPSGEGSEDPSDKGSEDPSGESSEDPSDEGSEDPSGEGSEDPSGEGSEDPTDEGSEDPTDESSEPSDESAMLFASSRAVHACFSDSSLSLDGNGSASFTYKKANGLSSGTTVSGLVYHYIDNTSNPGYCLEPDMSAPLNLYVTEETTTVGGTNTGSRGSKVWTKNLSTAQQDAVAMILLYGAPNNIWSDEEDEQSGYFAATQVMAWEIILGLRSTTYPYDYTSASNAKNLYNLFKLSSSFKSGYAAILADIQAHKTIPSFAASSKSSAPTITLTSDGTGYYTATVTDTNGILSKFNFTDSTGNVTFTKSGNNLTIKAKQLPSNTTFTGTRSVYSTTNSTFNLYYPGSDSYQTMLTVDTPATQTLSAYIVLELEETGRTFTLQKTADTTAACYAQIQDNPMYSLAGAKYQVSVGGTVMETLTTDANGQATSSLEYDIGTVVTIQETSAPSGYKLNSTAYTFTIADGDNTFSVSDAPVFDPPFAITKVDKKTTNPQGNGSFSGAVFKWEYFANTSWSGTATRTWYFATDADGWAYYNTSYLASGYTSDSLYVSKEGSPAIPLGTVKITEIVNSLGYIVLPEPLYVSIVQDNTTTSGVKIVWTDTSWGYIVDMASGNYGVYEPEDTSLYGSFTLTKTDKDTGAKLAGAKFQVINNSTNSVKIGDFAEAEPGSVCYEFTTGSDGTFSSGKIFPLGSYTIKEVSAPSNYFLNSDWSGSFTVSTSSNSFNFTCQDTGFGYAKFVKTTNTGNNLSGWGISLYYDAACTNLTGTYVTGSDGTITTGQLVHGTYYAKETSAPSGVDTGWWAMDTSVKTVSISAGVTANVQFSNTHYGRIQIAKSTNTGANLDGWIYDVKDSSGTVVATLTTGYDGTVTSGNLAPGTYTVTERSNGDPYWSCDTSAKTVTVTAGQTANVSVSNTHNGRVIVTKKTNTGNDLSGWNFGIYSDAACANLVATLTSGSDGKTNVAYLVPGTYYWKEISDNANRFGSELWVAETLNAQSFTIRPGEETALEFTNTHHGKIKVLKSLDTDGDLNGWRVKITDKSTGLEIAGSPFTTDANGEITTGILLPGEYVVEELFEENSLFYCKSENPQTVTVVAGNVTEVKFTNALRPGRIEIEKVNFSNAHLADAKFLLEWSEDGINWYPVTYSDKPDVVKGGCTTEGLTDGYLITDSSGIIAFEGLYPSLQYRVTELEAPEGYILLADYAFVDKLPVDDLEVVLKVFNSQGYVLPSTGVMDNTFFLISTGAFIAAFAMAMGLMVVYHNVSSGRRAVRRKNNYSPKYLRKDKV